MQQPISWVNEVELIFLLLLLFVVVFAWLARKLETPYPIVLVIAGLLLGLVPESRHSVLDRFAAAALLRCLAHSVAGI